MIGALDVVVAELTRDKRFFRELWANSERKQHLAEAATAEMKEKFASTTADLKEKLASARAELKILRIQKYAQVGAPHDRHDELPA